MTHIFFGWLLIGDENLFVLVISHIFKQYSVFLKLLIIWVNPFLMLHKTVRDVGNKMNVFPKVKIRNLLKEFVFEVLYNHKSVADALWMHSL